MSSADSIIGLGLPAELAKRAGFDVFAASTSTTLQNTGTGVLRGPGNKVVQGTFTTAADAFTLPADSGFGDIIIIDAVGANAGVVFPPVGGNLNGGTINTSLALAAGAGRMFVKINATRWATWVTG